MTTAFTLNQYGLRNKEFIRNAAPAKLYELAIRYEDEAAISDTGALMLQSGTKTGRSPKDKRIIERPESTDDIWWGSVNIKMDEHTFDINRQRAIDYFNTRTRLYVVDGYAGWDPAYQIKVRVICTRPYHALFMHNMLIRPTEEQLETFGEPDYVILNAGEFPANPYTTHMNSRTSVDLCFERKEFVILGTEYAGEMKKGVFTIMNYIMPKQNILSMHCSANEGATGDVSLFFGLSGTGKTTLSADARRHLIGDDEHCWSDRGIFNIEGGCYAKAINLSAEKEPEIYQAIRFGTVLENVGYNPKTHVVDYDDTSITENTRASYPIEFIPNARIPCVGGHPKNIIFLTCDAYGVLPPVAKLSPSQAMYHFISGYTAKVAGTEMGVTEPQATFSACFGAAFMVWHPNKYAELLAQKIQENDTHVWLVNTGWTGGAYGTGSRIKLKYTRSIIDAIHDGTLATAPTQTEPVFGFEIPTTCAGLPDEMLFPKQTWSDASAYDQTLNHLASLFSKNFEVFRDGCTEEIIAAGPKVS
ncbi:phosphoenolpyruvate carboxykinase (ATP) [Arundinibacter roseus]|uniref:Phosphoenolpyruvate carboxykinase (ATP) n=1 Tax=Arundinibacter roseus TaxID=2070510 RepID=A0A4V2XAK8_9BACT|nr:phosphoenolpyruvate carboxykinase (ATP) [Arundinibacter roseus]TDB67985.1 phosphoenolpyruvate carboxykinase (ATP) [Arundinibacter roseus]